MVVLFENDKPLRIDSDMIARGKVRDMSAMESVERRVRQLYSQPGAWRVTHQHSPDLAEITALAK